MIGSEPESIIAGGDLYLVYIDNMGHLDFIIMYPGGHCRAGTKIAFEDLCITARQKIEHFLLNYDNPYHRTK